jgi:hypothetical protein
VHCDHQLFPITERFNIFDFVVNCVSIPKQLQSLLLAMYLPPFLEHWEKKFQGSFKEEKNNLTKFELIVVSQTNNVVTYLVTYDSCFSLISM